MPLLFNLFLLLGRICSVSAAGLYSSGTSAAWPQSRWRHPHAWLHVWLHTWSLTYHYKIKHVTFWKHPHFVFTVVAVTSAASVVQRKEDESWEERWHVAIVYAADLYSKELAVYTSSNYWEIEELRHQYKCKYDIYSLLAPHPTFKDSGSSAAPAPAMLRSWLLHLPVVCR